MGNHSQTRGNREGFARTERIFIIKTEERSTIRPRRKNSLEVLKEVTNQGRTVQNAIRVRLLRI